MVDIHCHILPKIDDGSSGMEESVALARQAWASGVEKIAATPHFPGTEEALALLPRILGKTRRLQQELSLQNIPVELVPGAEVLCLRQTPELAQKGLLPTLGISRSVLTEFYFDMPGEEITRMLGELSRLEYRPVVAHPERYEAVQENPMLALEWFDAGYVLQVNKDSVLGNLGRSAEQTAARLLQMGIVHAIASDAHHVRGRNGDFSEIRRWTRRNLAPEYGRILLEENPRRILEGLAPVAPEQGR